MHYSLAPALLLATFAVAVGCASNPASGAKSADASEQPAATFQEQAQRGAVVYGKRCASCHGDAGQGGAHAPAVVGAGALPLDPPSGAKFRKARFVTVADVAEFVTKNMPPNAPGSLSGEDYINVLAFDLKANGIDLGDKKLDGALATTLVIPR
jgi:cytochrome c